MKDLLKSPALFIIISILASISAFLIGYLLYHPSIVVAYGVLQDKGLNTTIIISLISGVIPLSIYSEYRHRFNRSIEKNIATFFSLLSEGVSSGLSLVDSILKAGDTLKGPIGRACRDAGRKTLLGIEFTDSIRIFDKILGGYGRAIVNVITAAYLGGGSVEEMFRNASRAYLEYEKFRRDRIEKLKAISYVSYISLAVLLTVAYILINYFLPGIYGLSGLGLSASLSINFYESAFLWMSVFTSISSPLVFSKITYGDYRSGVKHIVIMLVITYIFFNFILPIKVSLPSFKPSLR